MITEPHLSHFNLKIGGAQASTQVMDSLLECTVENSLTLPDMAIIRLHDSEFKWLDSDLFTEGKSIEVLGGDEKRTLTPLFKGEITGVDLDLAAHGVPTIAIRCFDKSHRLHRGRFNRSFVQMTDTDIVNKIGAELGLNVIADSTSEVHAWVFQNDQTNWEFLTERAARNGFRLYVQGERDLYFKKVTNSADGDIELEWGVTLRSFRPRVSASPQVDEVVVRGWDPAKKTAIVGTCKVASGTPQVGVGGSGGDLASKAFGAAKMIVVDKPVHSQKEAEDLARSICDSIGGSFIEADGLCYGEPKMRPGMFVNVKNIGKRFSGKYHVTSTTHVYTPTEGYTTLFSVSGKQPATLLSILEGSKEIGKTPLGGNILIGIVTDNKDPEGMGRVKVKYPTLTEEHTSHWARISSPMAGGKRGLFVLPEIDDEVLVAFEHGDIHRPYVIGMLWNGKDAIPEKEVHGSGSVVDRRVFYTRIGHKMCFDDKGGKGDITLKTAGDHSLVIDDANKKVEITTNGKHKFTMDDGGRKITAKTTNGHEITLDDSGSRIVVKNSSGDEVEITDSGVVNVKANQTINLKAPNININANMALNMSGTNVSTDGKASVTVKGGATVDISAAMVKINS